MLDINEEWIESDEEIEEGEFIPTDVPEWKSDEEILIEEDDDVNEHLVLNQKMTEVEISGGESEIIKKVKEVGSKHVEEPFDTSRDVEPESVEPEATNEDLKKLWFKELPKREELAFKQAISVSGAENLKKGIICWIFDSELSLFVLKRFDGLQYLKNSRKSFNSLPLCELKELARMKLINLGDDPLAYVLERIIKREVFLNKFEQLSPSKGKRTGNHRDAGSTSISRRVTRQRSCLAVQRRRRCACKHAEEMRAIRQR